MKSKFVDSVRCIVLLGLLFCPMVMTAQCNGPSIPRELKLESADEYRQSDALAVDCMEWLLAKESILCPVKRQELDAFVMVWVSGHPDLVLEVEPSYLPFLDPFPELLFPSIYAMALHRLEFPQSQGLDLHVAAIERMLDLYGKLKPYRKSESFKHLRKARRKGKLKEAFGQ